MLRNLAALSLALCAALPAAADSVDDYVRAVMGQKKIPGISIAIVRDGKLAKAEGYGFANMEQSVPATADTIYQSGSTGKQFTAAGILLLAEEGKLSLDDRLSKHFPDGPSAWHRITIRQLLTHTSGIKDYEGENDIDLRKDYDEDALLKVMKGLPIQFEPGTQWSYSNSGYLILGLLTSKLAGKHWSEFQAERAIARYVDQGLTVVVLANLSAAKPETMAHAIAGLLEPKLRLPDAAATLADPDLTRAAKLRGVLEAWADSRTVPAMAKGLAETASGSSREAYQRRATGHRLAALAAFRFLGEDDLNAKPLSWRGESVTRIAHYALDTKDARHAYRFYLTKDGRVADFGAEES